MAKKNKDQNENVEKEGGAGSKIGTVMMVFLIIFVWLAIFALLIKMDFAGIGSNLLRPLLKDVPVLNLILPDATDEQLIYEEDYPYANISEAVDVIKQLEMQIDALNEQLDTANKTIADQAAEINRIKVFEDEYAAFEQRVRDFDINVVYNSQAPEVAEYAAWYEQINPDTAADIYRQIQEQLAYDEGIQEKADLLKNMKPANAASALEEMTADLEYTCRLLQCMKTDEATAIMDKMDTLFVARIIQKMHDMDVEWYESIQSNLLQNNTESGENSAVNGENTEN